MKEGDKYLTTKQTKFRKVGDIITIAHHYIKVVGFLKENGDFHEAQLCDFKLNSKKNITYARMD